MTATWDIAGEPNNRPRFIKPGQSYRFHGEPLVMHSLGVDEVRIRAEVMPGAECSGNRIADTHITQKGVEGIAGINMRPHLKKGTGNFHFTW